MHSDGAGTKSALAYMYWKETGDLSVWKGIAQDAVVMNIDDLLCAGATDNMLLSSTIGRNKNLIPAEVIGEIIGGTEEFLAKLRGLQINITLAGGETADVGDLVRTIIVDSSVICRLRRSSVIRSSKISYGDIIIGLASFGRASYEDTYNSGIGSNGLTSARHDTLDNLYSTAYPETFDPLIPAKLLYSGKRKLTEKIEVEWQDKIYSTDIGKLLLSPTRTYLPVIQEILLSYRNHIHGIIHCSGGGQTKILNFVNDLHIVKDNLFEVPPVFKIIEESSGTDPYEMYKVFNMGHRMELYVNPESVNHLIEVANKYNIEAKVIGHVEKYEGKKVSIMSERGTFTYS